MRKVLALIGAAILFGTGAVAAPPAGVEWRDWSDQAFAAARVQKRLVLLDLGAVWCHWCHVMEETTYRDPKTAGRRR